MKNLFLAQTESRAILADTTTPVSIYLRLRDVFPNTLLLESADYHSRENSMSYICLDPVAGIQVENGQYRASFPDGSTSSADLKKEDLSILMSDFCSRFQSDASHSFPYISDGLFGYMNYDCVQYFEDIRLKNTIEEGRKIPEMVYHVYRYVLAINHFKNEMHVFKHNYEGMAESHFDLDKLFSLIQKNDFGV